MSSTRWGSSGLRLRTIRTSRGGQASAGVGSRRGEADELVARASLEAGAVSVALTELELAGLVAGTDGVYRAVR